MRRAVGPNMATILEFRHAVKMGKFRRSSFNVSAEIVFFPGVRYERWQDQPVDKPKKRARRRDKLELDD
jgi:hypothetical protein